MIKKFAIVLMVCFSHFAFAAGNVIKGGDLVKISVYGNPDLNTEVKVTENGYVNFPLIGEVEVAGLSFSDAERKISQKLMQKGFLKQAQVNIIILQSKGQQVSVLGQVVKPGKYPIETGAKTLFDFIAISGGVSAKGSDVVTVIRMNEDPPKRHSVNINHLLLDADAEKISQGNMEMEAGDIIYVPEAPVFYVYGEARSPGVFRYKPGMTMAQAIATAGGISGKGSINGLEISRRDAKGALGEVDAELSTPILPDDVIYVKESLF